MHIYLYTRLLRLFSLMGLIFDSYVTLSKEEFLVHLQEDSKKGDVGYGSSNIKVLQFLFEIYIYLGNWYDKFQQFATGDSTQTCAACFLKNIQTIWSAVACFQHRSVDIVLGHIYNMNFQFWAIYGQSGLQRKKIQTAISVPLLRSVFLCFHRH